jgi:selenocysteine-specific elongation factor
MSTPLTLGTGGHIDHGKTALVEALTGTNTDHLPEERRRGISIELGFAALVLPSGRRVSVVDVPGHERFVRTMVAGATGVDLFLLVVAADDGVMPQTREHLAVLEVLGVPAGVVAVTKTDLVDREGAELASAEVSDLLTGGSHADAEVVLVSARSGTGIAELTDALERAASSVERRRDRSGAARLHVDRSFTLHGAGTVVTGTLWSGTLVAGREVSIAPGGHRARIRSIEVHGRPVDAAAAGQRVAVNLAGIDRREVARGDIVGDRDAVQATYLLDASVVLLSHARPLRRGERVHVHHGTRESPARVTPLEDEAIEPGQKSYAQLRLEQPLLPAAGDRFVLRRLAPADTVGGGVVLDPSPRRHGPGSAHVRRLRLIESGDPLERLEARLSAAASGLTREEADEEALARLARAGRARRVGGERARWLAPERYEEARAALVDALDQAGDGRPLSRGALADAARLEAQTAQALLDELVRDGQAMPLGPGFVARSALRELDPLSERLVELLRSDLLEPRSVDALAEAAGASAAETREALERLVLAGQLTLAKPGLYYHPDGLAEARRQVISICNQAGSVTIARLRDELGTSRKFAQALLERLDAERLTVRRGDLHLLRGAGSRDPATGTPVR